MFKVFFNNYAGLVIEGCFYKYKLLLLPAVFIFFGLALVISILGNMIFWYVIWGIMTFLWVYLAILALVLLWWRHKSTKMGFKSFIIFPGSSFWLKKMLAKRNIDIPVFDDVIEIHVNTREKYKDWNEYNSGVDNDIERLISCLNAGKFGSRVTVTFNTFNRRLVDKLGKAFNGRGIRIKQVTLPDWIIYSYHPGRFKKVQRRMFGEVKSTRAVHVPEAWELLIYNFELKGGKAV